MKIYQQSPLCGGLHQHNHNKLLFIQNMLMMCKGKFSRRNGLGSNWSVLLKMSFTFNSLWIKAVSRGDSTATQKALMFSAMNIFLYKHSDLGNSTFSFSKKLALLSK